MKIFIIARGYPSVKEPTWGCFEKDQAEALASLGHNVTILSVDTRFRWYWRRLGITKKIANGIKIYDFFFLYFLFVLQSCQEFTSLLPPFPLISVASIQDTEH